MVRRVERLTRMATAGTSVRLRRWGSTGVSVLALTFALVGVATPAQAAPGDQLAAGWGDNSSGQLGDGTSGTSLVPVQVDTSSQLGGRTVTAVAAGGSHTCALSDRNVAFCWGNNTSGQLGHTAFPGSSYVPVVVQTGTMPWEPSPFAKISAGDSFTCAVYTDGTVHCWGFNGNGQLGDGTTTNRGVPVAVTTAGTPLAGKTVATVSAGAFHTCAVATDGTTACWGGADDGQLGNGTTSDSSVPVAVTTAGTPLAGKTVATVSAGYFHTCAAATDRTTACWGGNAYGQLGDATTTSSSVPVAVAALSAGPLGARPVLAVDAGGTSTAAVYGFSTRPGAPTGLAMGGTPTTLSWAAPAYSGGGALTDYGVYYRIPGGSADQQKWKLFARGITTTSFDLTANASAGCVGATDCRRLHGALQVGTAYQFQTLAFTATGNGKSPTPVNHTWNG